MNLCPACLGPLTGRAARPSAPTPEGIAENCARARAAGCSLVEKAGPIVFPVIPHQTGRDIEHIGDYAFWIAGTLELMRRCDAVLTLPRGVPSLRDGKFIAESRTLLPALADLAESEGKRADEAERERAKSDAAYEALFKRTTTAINAMRTERDAALAELAKLKGQQP